MRKIILLIFITLSLQAWEGYDYDKDNYVDIESGNKVRSGSDIEIYDYSSGEYRDVEVESVERYGGSIEVEVYDYDTGEYRTLEMD